MKRFFITLLMASGIAAAALAQPSDMIMLKKGNKTVDRYFAGRHISFTADNGAYRDAEITQIINDSIYLREYLIHRIPTTAGFYITDTAGSFRYVYHYKQIKYLGAKSQKNFNVSGSGAALFGGGILLTLGSGVMYFADREKFSPELMLAAMGLGITGYLMSKSGQRPIEPGKRKYRIEYLDLQK